MSHWFTPPSVIHRPWPPEEWTKAQQLLTDGLGYSDIAVRLNRTTRAVKAKFQKERMTPEQRLARAEYQRRKRSECIKGRTVSGLTFVRSVGTAVEQVVTERNARANLAPRDLTAAFFNDPLPGYSALDKKLAEGKAP